MKRIYFERAVLITVLIFTLSNLVLFFSDWNIGGLIIGLLGIAILGIYAKDKKILKPLTYAWIFAQFIYVTIGSSFIYAPTTFMVDITFGLNFENFAFRLNLVPLIALGVYQLFLFNNLSGQIYEIKVLKAGAQNPLTPFLPQKCEGLEVAMLPNDKSKWLKLKMEKPFTAQKVKYDFFLVKTKSGEDYTEMKFYPSHVKIGNHEMAAHIPGVVLVKKIK